jgi:hypothetical protein
MDARAESPARPKTSGYPAVQDLPPKREKPAMTADEASERTDRRARSPAQSVKPVGGAARAEPIKP